MGSTSRVGRWSVAALMLGVVAATPVPAQASVMGVANCRDGGAGDYPVYDMTVRNMACGTAKRAVKRGDFSANGFKTRGWRCRQIGTYQEGGLYRCTAGRRAFRWTSGG